VRVTNNYFEGCGGKIINVDGGLASRSGLHIEFNSALNMNAGAMQFYGLDSHFVSFTNVAGGYGNSISYNRILNDPVFSFTTDVFNTFQSGGNAVSQLDDDADPNWLTIQGNIILGGNYYNFWGSGGQ